MADRVKGITIEIGGNTTGLNKALAGTNKEIRDTQSQLKDVERLLRLDPTNITLLEQKQRLLAQSVGETKTKLETLKTAEKQVQEQFERGDITQQQYDALQREIVQTEQELKKLEAAAESSNAKLSYISATAEKVGESAQKVSSATRGLSTAAAGAAVGLGAMAVSAGAAADDINTLAKQSGFGTDEIQKWQYAADRIDVSVETIVGSARKMKKNMVSTSKETTEAWEKLGVAVSDQNGEMRDSTEVFYEAVSALSQVQNETERDTIAMQLFGKSADEMAGIIDDGGEALREMGEEAERNGLILSQDALDGANAFNDGIDTLKAKAQQAFFSSGAALAENLLPLLDSLVEKISAVLSWVASLDGDTLAMIGTILLAVASISPIAGIITKITTAIQGVSNAINFIVSNPIILLIAAIVALVTLIATKGDEIQAILQKVDDFLQNIFAADWTESFGAFGNVLNAFFANVKNIWDAIKKIFDGIIDFIRGVFTGDWERAWSGVKQIFSGIFDALVSIAKAPINGIIGILNAAIDGINMLIGGINKISFDVPKWVPGLGGKKFGFDIKKLGKISYLANGGVLSQGSAVVGEAGPEILTMLANGKAQVTPLTDGQKQSALHSVNGPLILIDNFNNYSDQDIDRLTDMLSVQMQQKMERRGLVWG